MKKQLLPLLLPLLLACSKNESGNDDRELPVVVLSTPVANQVFNAGESIAVTGSISDNHKLSEVHVHISNSNTGNLLIDIHRYPGAASYDLNETFTAQAGITYKIQVIAKDNAANENRATVEVSSN